MMRRSFPQRTWVPAAAALAALLVALSLGREMVVFGHNLGPGPYRLLHLAVPGFQYIRIPERLGLLAMLFVALLSGARPDFLRAARARPLAAAALALAAAVPLEHLSPSRSPCASPSGTRCRPSTGGSPKTAPARWPRCRSTAKG